MSLPKLSLSLCIAIFLALLCCAVTSAQVSPADPSFSATSDVQALSYSFGTFRQGDPGSSLNFSVFNRAAPLGSTSPTSLSSITSFGDTSAMPLNTGSALHIQPGGHADMQLNLTTNQLGNLEAVYTLSFLSDSIAAPPVDLTIAASATVLANGDYDADLDVDASDYILWRKTLGQNVTLGTGADGNRNGVVDQFDYAVWRANFAITDGSGNSLIAAFGVPEPATCASCFLGFSIAGLVARRRRRNAQPALR
jgi:hypothetical protein